MKKIILLISLIFCIVLGLTFFSCKTSGNKTDVTDKKATDSNKNSPEDKGTPGHFTGWNDNDTYIVHVVSSDLSSAIDLAKTKILKDIIKIRYKIYGTHERLRVIKEEFRDPLKNGEVIRQKQLDNGIEIYFQIKDRDLKKKFETK
jgi:hypothetical protein